MSSARESSRRSRENLHPSGRLPQERPVPRNQRTPPSCSKHTLLTTSLQFKPGVPIEVVPFAYAKVLQNLRHILDCPKANLRMAVAKAGPVVTDNGNFIIDAPFDQERMKEPYTVRHTLP